MFLIIIIYIILIIMYILLLLIYYLFFMEQFPLGSFNYPDSDSNKEFTGFYIFWKIFSISQL